MRAAFGCLAALAIWEGSQKKWLLSILGLTIVGIAIEYGGKTDFPFDLLIYSAGFVVLSIGKHLFVNPKPWKQRWEDHFRSFKEYRDARKIEAAKGTGPWED